MHIRGSRGRSEGIEDNKCWGRTDEEGSKTSELLLSYTDDTDLAIVNTTFATQKNKRIAYRTCLVVLV